MNHPADAEIAIRSRDICHIEIVVSGNDCLGAFEITTERYDGLNSCGKINPEDCRRGSPVSTNACPFPASATPSGATNWPPEDTVRDSPVAGSIRTRFLRVRDKHTKSSETAMPNGTPRTSRELSAMTV